MTPEEAAQALKTLWGNVATSIAGSAVRTDNGYDFAYEISSGKVELSSNGSTITGRRFHGSNSQQESDSSLSMNLLGKPGSYGYLAGQIAEDFISNAGMIIGLGYAQKIGIDRIAKQAQKLIDSAVKPIFTQVMRSDGVDSVDLDLIRILGASGHLSDAIAYRYYNDDTPHREWRRQILDVWPMFAGTIGRTKILGDSVDRGSGINEALAEIVDVKPKFLSRFQKSIIDLHALSAVNFIRNVSLIPPDLIPKGDEIQLQALSNVISLCKPLMDFANLSAETLLKGSKGNWVKFFSDSALAASEKRMPEAISEEDAKILISSLNRLNEIARTDKATAIALIQPILKEASYGGDVNAAQLWLTTSIDPARNGLFVIKRTIIDLMDMLSSGAEEFILPLAAKSGKKEAYGKIGEHAFHLAREFVKKITIAEKNLPSSMEVLRKYKLRSEEVRSKENELTYEDVDTKKPKSIVGIISELGLHYPQNKYSWSPWFAPIQAPNGLWICDLNNDRLLYYEGTSGVDPSGARGMNHCCACYNKRNVDLCIPHSGKTHILSIRKLINGRYFRMGTALITDYDAANGNHQNLNISNYLYHSNSYDTPKEGQEALDWFLEAARTGEINFTYTPGNSQSHLISDSDHVGTICGYDWHDENELIKIKQIWDECIDNNTRKITVDQMGELQEIMDLTKSISPSVKAIKSVITKMPKLTL